MEIMLLDLEDMLQLDRLADSWIAETVSEIGPSVDKPACLSGVASVMASGRGAVLGLVDDGEVVGILCIDYGAVAYSVQRMAKERYFYLLPQYRGRWTTRIRQAAEDLAQRHGCTHIVFTISAKASKQAPRIVDYFLRCGYDHFEQSVIKELK